ncbi:amino acid permease [Fructilactobacillus lindneri]|uniref:Amino acid permease n=2 Tax=Fructilactobacillus lindneri TaxID=53444 RepID=A0A0R2JQC3_9LACO|nr:amino acid permease [Fructilactobacillus lindneri]ANZ57292.1 amino acid permease [Fructilactobacillus lindneri]ANZ58557.1 amino acid permease [Fructilactobacillus lindneri]KRN79327.1 amino acid permease [Fructilactobacillus lindneri DSM 20690 = JCM 11027]POG98402.1 amino acid permease [Fructilactobacillus lindneri]POH03801.1 amino acid permease [Fructilactobacillus lindneri]
MAAQSHKKHLAREMTSRQVLMISLGGVIGTGLFLSSGYTIHEAGPIGTIIAYLIGAIIVYLVMLCLGEISVAMPETGSFHVYAQKYLGKSAGFVVAILYWLTWTIALGSEFTAAGLIMQHWFPTISTWIWSLGLIILIFVINAFSVKWFAETEFWFSSVKVAAIVAFILLGSAAIFGIFSFHGTHQIIGFKNFYAHGWFPNGFSGVFTTMLTVNFAFSGTELIGITAGETKDPATTIPKAIKTTLWRLILFFIGSMVVMSALIPYQQAGVTQSPFVLIFSEMGIPFAADIMNLVVLTAIISAANSGLYASTRMLWSLANEGLISRVFQKTNRQQIPIYALTASMIGGIFALFSAVYAAGSVYLVLVSISGLAVVFVWMAIALSELQFRKKYLASGKRLSDLVYRTPFYPWTPILAFILCFLSCVLIWFDPNQRIALYYTIPFVLICYLFYEIKLRHQRRKGVAHDKGSR